jgi:hypothetical protein
MSGSEVPPSGARGDAAWKEHLQQVTARNEEARRVGKQQRQEKERLQEQRRSAQERRTDSELTRSFERGSRRGPS